MALTIVESDRLDMVKARQRPRQADRGILATGKQDKGFAGRIRHGRPSYQPHGPYGSPQTSTRDTDYRLSVTYMTRRAIDAIAKEEPS